MHTAPACTSSMSVCVCSAQKNACLCDGKVLTGQVCLCVSFVRKAHWHPNNEGSNASLRRSIYSGEAHVCVICVCVCLRTCTPSVPWGPEPRSTQRAAACACDLYLVRYVRTGPPAPPDTASQRSVCFHCSQHSTRHRVCLFARAGACT